MNSIINKIAVEYPSLDLEAINILLTIYENPGCCIREVADILSMNQKAVQLRITLMGEGRKGRKSSSLNLINVDYKKSDRRKRDLMLTPAGEELAKMLGPLNNNHGTH